jgi:hypothetical protein
MSHLSLNSVTDFVIFYDLRQFACHSTHTGANSIHCKDRRLYFSVLHWGVQPFKSYYILKIGFENIRFQTLRFQELPFIGLSCHMGGNWYISDLHVVTVDKYLSRSETKACIPA